MSSTRLSSSNNASFVLNTLSFSKIFSFSYLKDKTKKIKETLMSVKIDLQQCGIIINKVDPASVKKCSNLLGKAIAKLESLEEMKRTEEKKLKYMIEVLIKILKSFDTKKFSFKISSLIKDIDLDKSFDQLSKYDESSSSDDSSSSDESSSSDDSSSSDADESSSDDTSSDSEDDKKKRKKSTKGKTSKRPKVSDKKVDIKTLERYAKFLSLDKKYGKFLKRDKKRDKNVKFETIVLDE